jgi:hypothetical protein
MQKKLSWKIDSDKMLQAIIDHSFDLKEVEKCKKILDGSIDRKREYMYTGAFTRAILDGDFRTAVRFADKENIVAFVALLAEGNYPRHFHKALSERMHLIGMDRPKFMDN